MLPTAGGGSSPVFIYTMSSLPPRSLLPAPYPETWRQLPQAGLLPRHCTCPTPSSRGFTPRPSDPVLPPGCTHVPVRLWAPLAAGTSWLCHRRGGGSAAHAQATARCQSRALIRPGCGLGPWIPGRRLQEWIAANAPPPPPLCAGGST